MEIPGDFWRETPRTWLLKVEARLALHRRQRREALTDVWLGVAMSGLRKEMPDLEDLLEPYADPDDAAPAPRPRKSPQEVRALLNQLKADFQGDALRQADIDARRAARQALLDNPAS